MADEWRGWRRRQQRSGRRLGAVICRGRRPNFYGLPGVGNGGFGGGGGGGYSGGGGGAGFRQSGVYASGGVGGGWFSADFSTLTYRVRSGYADGHGAPGRDGYAMIGNGARVFQFRVTDAVEEYTVKHSGQFYLYAAGGQGGGGAYAGDTGGITLGLMNTTYQRAGTKLYVAVGAAGAAGYVPGVINIGGGGGGGTFIWAVSGAPEPSSWLSLEIGVLGVGFALRRRFARTSRV